jgi:hypothetical protein
MPLSAKLYAVGFLLCLACEGQRATTESPAPSASSADAQVKQADAAHVPDAQQPPPKGSCMDAPATFSNALCLCGDLRNVGQGLFVSQAGKEAVHVGVNGQALLVGSWGGDGDWHLHEGLSGAGDLAVSGDLGSHGDVQVVGALSTGGDLSVGGDLFSVGELSVGGALAVGGAESIVGESSFHHRGALELPHSLPCACEAEGFLDVGERVREAKHHNDNAKLNGQAPGAMHDGSMMALHPGSYYFQGLHMAQSMLHIHGAVSVYVDGDLESVDHGHFQLEPGATLDFYVSGSVKSVGLLHLAMAESPSAVRLYIGGDEPVTVSGTGHQEYMGSIYAPRATLNFTGETVLEGALFAHELSSVGKLEVRYRAPEMPPECPTQMPPEPHHPGPVIE